ncbi:MAG: DUF1080 domain-containing protein [Rubripirellula sp.]
MNLRITLSLLAFISWSSCFADQPSVALFDGTNTEMFEFREGAWVIDEEGSLTCRMEEVKQKNGKVRQKGMGYAWTKSDYENFQLTLAYKLSEGANSGVFFRTDPNNPVQGGFEIQLLDDRGFQLTHGKKDGKNLNGAFYDCQAASADPAKPIGQWNQLKLTVNRSKVQIEINGVLVNDFDIDRWDTANKNPDGSDNKFKTALRDLPRTGRIGLQNHGNVVWFKDAQLRKL